MSSRLSVLCCHMACSNHLASGHTLARTGGMRRSVYIYISLRTLLPCVILSLVRKSARLSSTYAWASALTSPNNEVCMRRSIF